MRKKILLAVTAAALLTAVVPAMAQADDWAVNGTPITGTTAATATGVLTLNAPATGVTVSCEVTISLSLDPAAAGSVTAVAFATPCDTNINANCKVVAASASNLPWAIAGDATAAEAAISGIQFSNTFATTPFCGPFSGDAVTATAAADIVPTVSGNTITFNGTSSGVLGSALGNQNLTGSLDLVDVANGDPVTLVP